MSRSKTPGGRKREQPALKEAEGPSIITGLVAIVGRPNVGKSTLFNRLTRTRKAIVDDRPGVTRDRIYGICEPPDSKTGFMVIDTGGFETKDHYFQPFADNLVWKQTETAIKESDLVILLFDGKTGIHPHDRELVDYLKKINKPVVYAVNKIDGDEQSAMSWDFYKLGVSNVLTISAAHNKGIRDLRGQILAKLKDLKASHHKAFDYKGATRIALIGRPNAGKSSILNRILGQERSVVSEVAGTTRDSIDAEFVFKGKPYVIIDTAGIRRKTRISDDLEISSVIQSLKNIEQADMVLYVVDALEGITDQDARLINLAIDRFKTVLIVINKWDLVPDKDTHTSKIYAENIHERILQDISFIPVHFVSCLENQRVFQILEKVEKLREEALSLHSTSHINQILEELVSTHSPHVVKKFTKRIKFYFAAQTAVDPPTLTIQTNLADEIHDSYKKFMVKTFRSKLNWPNVPIKLILKKKSDRKRA